MLFRQTLEAKLSPPRDTDGDGYMDIQEMLAGTDKDDPCDPDPECAACLALKPAVTPTPTPTPKPWIPGFEAVFAIAGLLAVAYLVVRRKKGRR